MKKSKRMTIREKRNKRLLTLATVGEAFYMGYMKGGCLGGCRQRCNRTFQSHVIWFYYGYSGSIC